MSSIVIDPRDCPGNVFLFTYESALTMDVVLRHVRADDEQQLIDFVTANILGRLFYLHGSNLWVWCPYGRKQKADGAAVTFFKLEELSAQARSCRELVPACIADETGAGPHWMRWVTGLQCYHEYMNIRMGPGRRRLIGVSLSPQPNAPKDGSFLIMSAPPLYVPRHTSIDSAEQYQAYVDEVKSLKIPGTDIPFVTWHNSFMYWVNFDGDIPSFINFMAMMTCTLNPAGWSPGKIFVVSGKQGAGKSEKLNWISGFLNPINFCETAIDTLSGKTFNDSLIKPMIVCHEGGSDWEKMCNAFVRSLITDMGEHQFEKKYGAQSRFWGTIFLYVALDRKLRNSLTERRLLHCVVAKDPKLTEDHHSFKYAVRLASRLMSQSNESLNSFREESRQAYVNFLGPYFSLICPTGIKPLKIFDRQDSWNDQGDDEQKASVKTTGAPPAKRARTQGSGVSTNLVDVVNALAGHLANYASIFPLDDPWCIYNLFHNLAIFSEKDTPQFKNNVILALFKATWSADRSVYSLEISPGVVERFDDTLASIFDQFKTEDESTEISQTREDKAHRKSVAFRRMLAKFKECLMVRAYFDFDPQLPAWPRSLYGNVALWILGMWVNFKSNNNRLNDTGLNWGESGVDYERLAPVARLLLQRLGGRDGFAGGKHVIIKADDIQRTLKINLSFYIGPGKTTLELRPVSLNWGAFSIIRNLVAVGGPEFRPTEDQIEMIVRRYGGENAILDKNRDDYDTLICSTKRHLMDQMYRLLTSPDGLLAVEDESRIFALLYGDLLGRNPLGVMDKGEFYATLPIIDAAVQAAKNPVGFRPSFALRRTPEELGEQSITRQTIEPTKTRTTRQESQDRDQEATEQKLFRFGAAIEQTQPIVEYYSTMSPIATPPILRHDDEESTFAGEDDQTQQLWE